jgi:hypothetical protein
MTLSISSQQNYMQLTASFRYTAGKVDHSENRVGCQCPHVASGDTVTLAKGPVATAATYDASPPAQNRGDADFDLLRAYVASLLQEVGVATEVATGGEAVDISTLTPDKAQELVGEDGYFGVEQTSERIVDFAIATAGGDSSRLAAIKEGIDRGFQEAADAFGGWLPDISYQTYDAIMEKLDSWASTGV